MGFAVYICIGEPTNVVHSHYIKNECTIFPRKISQIRRNYAANGGKMYQRTRIRSKVSFTLYEAHKHNKLNYSIYRCCYPYHTRWSTGVDGIPRWLHHGKSSIQRIVIKCAHIWPITIYFIHASCIRHATSLTTRNCIVDKSYLLYRLTENFRCTGAIAFRLRLKHSIAKWNRSHLVMEHIGNKSSGIQSF